MSSPSPREKKLLVAAVGFAEKLVVFSNLHSTLNENLKKILFGCRHNNKVRLLAEVRV